MKVHLTPYRGFFNSACGRPINSQITKEIDKTTCKACLNSKKGQWLTRMKEWVN